MGAAQRFPKKLTRAVLADMMDCRLEHRSDASFNLGETARSFSIAFTRGAEKRYVMQSENILLSF